MESRAIFTSRHTGKSNAPYNSRNLALHVGDNEELVRGNRRDLAAELGVLPERLFFMEQTHGVEVVLIDEKSDNSLTVSCDAMITRTPGTALAVMVADCAPLLLVGEHTTAAIHVGWRGLFDGIVEKVIDLMAGERFRALIGPTICGKCYRIGEDLHLQAQQREFITGVDTLDIPQSILKILRNESGTSLISSQWNGICTFESADHYSYRRDGITGRQAGVVIHGS